MDFSLSSILRNSVIFTKNAYGVLFNPYVTYRELAASVKNRGHVIYISLLTFLYFVFASLVRTGLKNPYLLTLKFNSLFIAGSLGFFGMVIFLYLVGKIFKSPVSLETLITLWSYTLLPTLTWFFLTSILYILLPPPRSLSILGKLYSAVFIAFSIAILLWKCVLSYLTFRFGLRLDLYKISAVLFILIPVIAGYSLMMYRLGVFRIPFL